MLTPMTATSRAGDRHRVTFDVSPESAGCQRALHGSVPDMHPGLSLTETDIRHSPHMLPYSPRVPVPRGLAWSRRRYVVAEASIADILRVFK
jgi:hypothetical protein